MHVDSGENWRIYVTVVCNKYRQGFWGPLQCYVRLGYTLVGSQGNHMYSDILTHALQILGVSYMYYIICFVNFNIGKIWSWTHLNLSLAFKNWCVVFHLVNKSFMTLLEVRRWVTVGATSSWVHGRDVTRSTDFSTWTSKLCPMESTVSCLTSKL